MSLLSLGKRIRELRQQKGFSMRKLAALAKLKSPAYISDLERGFRHPSPKVMAKLAAALETPLAQLRSCDPRPPLAELTELARKNGHWTPALRLLLETVEQGLSPKEFVRLLRSHRPVEGAQPDLLNLPLRAPRAGE